MVKIAHQNSSSGQISVQQPKNYVVEDLHSELSEFEAPKEQVMQQEVKENVTKKLESIIFSGRLKKDVYVSGVKYTLSTLSHKENSEMLRKMLNTPTGNPDIFIIRTVTLAQCIKSINDINIENIEVPGEFSTIFDKKIELIDNLQMAVVERLYAEYEKLVQENDDLVKNETIKNS